MDRDPLRRWWPTLAVAALLGAAAVAAGHSSIGLRPVAPAADDVPVLEEYSTALPSLPPTLEPRPSGAAQAAPTEVPGWLGAALTVVLALVVAGILGLVLWSVLGGAIRRRMRTRWAVRSPTIAGQATEEVVAALDAGLVQLDDAATDPRTAVIACWVRLEEAAAAVGVPRRVGDTPTDLVTRLLRGDPVSGTPAVVSADVLAEFARVYREARYATHAVDERMRDQARTALRRLRGELTTARSMSAEEVPAP
ncbi:DUF4129 domain-containing protein [Plantactinospora sp. GCM10030261]|uniref:DUF4129 domain-containing protein n=1 Tax=Plantactinospora sp. GCM10030261 TaxID=3273420 RepID=UPI00361AE81B